MTIKVSSWTSFKKTILLCVLLYADVGYAAQVVVNAPSAVPLTAAGNGDSILVTGTGNIITGAALVPVTLAGPNTFLTVNTPTAVGGGLVSQTGTVIAVQLSNNNTTVNNSGTIQTGLATAIFNTVLGSNGATINNSGTILGPNANSVSVNLGNVTLGQAVVNQSAGTMQGIILPNAATATSNINITGGSITSNIILNAPAVAGNTFNINVNDDFIAGGTFGSAGAGNNATSINVNNNGGTLFSTAFGMYTNQFINNSGVITTLNPGGSLNTLTAVNGTLSRIQNFGILSLTGASNIITANENLNATAFVNNAGAVLSVNTAVGSGVTISGTNNTFTNNGIASFTGTSQLALGQNSLNNTGTFTFWNTGAIPAVLTGGANSTVINSGTMSFTNASAITGPIAITNSNGGTMTFADTATISPGAVNTIANAGNFSSTSTSTLNITTFTNTNTASFSSGGIAITGAGNVNNNAGTFSLSGASIITGGAGSTVTNNAIMNLSNTASIAANAVNNNGTFNLTNTGGVPITVNAGAGTFNNAGTLNLQTTSGLPVLNGNLVNTGNVVVSTTQNMTGNYTQNAGSNFTTNIFDSGPGQFGTLHLTGVNTANLAANSRITTNLIGNGTKITQGETFDILTTTGLITDNSTLVATGNPLVSFTKSTVATGTGNAIRLTATRVPLSNFVNSTTLPALGGLIDTLEAIRNTPLSNKQPFLAMLTGLDATFLSGGATALQNALLQFLPDVSGALKMIPIWQFEDMSFRPIDNRLERVAALQRSRDYIPVQGYVAGDSILGQECTGPLVFGTIGQQKVPMINFPYDYNTGGVGFFTDRGIADCLYVGLTGTYSFTTVLYKNNTGSKTTISTTQGGIYGSYNKGWAFLDGIFMYGINYYQSKRVQPLIAQTSQGSFTGNQGSARIRGGFAVPIRYLDIIPIGSIQYTQVHIGSYRENGGAALAIPSQAFTSAIWGLGVRLSLHNLDTDVKTEIHGMYYQDMKASPVTVTTQFIDGGPAFIAIGNNPKKNHYNAGGSANVLIIPNLTLCFSYDFLQQEGLKSSNFFLRLRWIH